MSKKNIIVHSVYLILIAVLITTVVILSVSLKKEQMADNENRVYYEMKCDSYKVQNTNLSEGQIVFVGDSITDLCPLDKYYSDLPLAVYNRGIGGDTTTGVLARLQVSIFDIKPSKVVLMIGTNDINGGVSETTILHNYSEILTKIKSELPNTEIFCMSIIPQNLTIETYSTIKVAETTPKILSINEQIETLALSKGLTYLDLFSLISDSNNFLIESYSDDGLHLNVNGFAVWSTLIKPYLQ